MKGRAYEQTNVNVPFAKTSHCNREIQDFSQKVRVYELTTLYVNCDHLLQNGDVLTDAILLLAPLAALLNISHCMNLIISRAPQL